MRCEIIIDGSEILKGKKIITAMANSAKHCNIDVVITKKYKGDSDLLMIYGLGHYARGFAFKQHVQSGRHAICWDLGYFGREQTSSFPMRLSIDKAHPQHLMTRMNIDRWERANIKLRNDFNKDGPIVLVGTGDKERNRLGIDGPQWEMTKLYELKKIYPNKKIIYRPKGDSKEQLLDCQVASGNKIEKVISGSSLVVVKHSNVAIDACIAGIPVSCEDGAASYLYNNDLVNPKNPSENERYNFLCSLAYWQWRCEESKECWEFIKKTV